jgi:hypothetical protein
MGRKRDDVPDSYLGRLYQARKLVDRGIVPDDGAFRERFPLLFELLTSTHVSVEEVTQAAFLRVTNSAGDWAFQVVSPGLGGQCEALVKAFEEGLPALELHLGEGTQSFRFWERRKPKIRKNGKLET